MQVIHEWLSTQTKMLPQLETDRQSYPLLHHCTERSMLPDVTDQWKLILNQVGIHVHSPQTGCCGMAGIYGHQVEHVEDSKTLYAASWQKQVEHNNQLVLVTGQSCRSQVKRCSNQMIMHPVEFMVQRIESYFGAKENDCEATA